MLYAYRLEINMIHGVNLSENGGDTRSLLKFGVQIQSLEARG